MVIIGTRYLFISAGALRFSGENLVPINVTPVDGGRRSSARAASTSPRVRERESRGPAAGGKNNGKDLCL